MATGAGVKPLVFTRQGLAELDRNALGELGIPTILLMEHAAMGLAREIGPLCRESGEDSPMILCGGGNNGGDGYAVARLLANSGFTPILIACGTPKEGSDCQVNARIAEKMGLECRRFEPGMELSSKVLVDCIFGTGYQPRDAHLSKTAATLSTSDQAIQAVNQAKISEGTAKMIISVDIPSGLDADSGQPGPQCIKADITITLVGLKQGYSKPQAQEYLGRVIVQPDIGVPDWFSRRHAITTPS